MNINYIYDVYAELNWTELNFIKHPDSKNAE